MVQSFINSRGLMLKIQRMNDMAGFHILVEPSNIDSVRIEYSDTCKCTCIFTCNHAHIGMQLHANMATYIHAYVHANSQYILT